MDPTVEWLLNQRELRLRALTEEGRGRSVRWVHISELADPTPYLSGGELLLTTGMHARTGRATSGDAPSSREAAHPRRTAGTPTAPAPREPGDAHHANGSNGPNGPEDPVCWRRYVERLTARGVAALGFGVGLGHEEVPAALVEAAREAALPLLRVPEPTPFIAISETVAEAIARTEEEALASAFQTQRDLISAALADGGPRAVANELSRALGCWVVLLDENGATRHSTPPDARRHAARVRTGLERLPHDARDTPAHAASLDIGGDRVTILPVGARGRVVGYLAAGRTTPPSPAEHTLLAGAVGLLSLDASYQYRNREAERRARLAVLRLATGAHQGLAEPTADTLGVALPPSPLRVAVLGYAPRRADSRSHAPPAHPRRADSRANARGGHRGAAHAGDRPRAREEDGRAGAAELLHAAEQHLGLNQAGALVAAWDRYTVVVLLPEAEGDLQALEEVLHRVPGSRGAVSEAAPFGELPDALRRARSVFYGAGTSREPGGGAGRGDGAGAGTGKLLLAEDVATAGLLAQLDHPGAQSWADVLLEPLDRHAGRSKLDLVSTLRIFLAHNGHIDASATALGIHRHTLRYRLDRVTALLGSDLENPTVRAELWLALLLREAR